MPGSSPPGSPTPGSPTPGRDPAEGSREAVEPELKRDDPAEACDRKVDEAVEMTFPASDPTATGRATGTEPAARPSNRQASIPSKEDIERAAAGRG
jgi:hypothetical protein